MLSLLFSCIFHVSKVKCLFQRSFPLLEVEVSLGRKAIIIGTFMKYASIFRFFLSFRFSCMGPQNPAESDFIWPMEVLELDWALQFGMPPVKPEQNQFRMSYHSPVHCTPLPAKITMNQQHVINLYLTEAPASIRHCPPNLLNNVEWLSAEVMIFSVKSQQSILFSLLKIWHGPTEAFLAEAGSPILAVPQAGRAHSDGDVFHLCLYVPACAHVSIASSHGPSTGM